MSSALTAGDASVFVTLAEHPFLIAAAIAVIAFVESFALVGLLVPGVAILAAAAFAAGGAHTPLSAALLAAWFGAVLGDGSSFLLGRHFGAGLRHRAALARYRPWLERGEAFFDRHGILGIVLGRFVGPIRPVTPLIAGMVRMSPPAFFTANLVSAIVWAPAYVLPGYLVGASLAQTVPVPENWPIALAASCAMLWLTLSAVKRAWRAGAAPEDANPDAETQAPGSDLPRSASGLRTPLPGGHGSDTWLSLLLASMTLCLALSGTLAILSLPVVEPWRSYLGALGSLLAGLW